MAGGDIAHVKWRVLPHQHNVNIAAQIKPFALAFREMIALNALNGHGCTLRHQPVISIQGKAFDMILVKRVPPSLRGLHQRKRAVARDIHAFNRVHLNGNFEVH